MADDTPDLTDKQAHVVSLLPAAKSDIADELAVAPTTVEGHFDRLQDKGVGLQYDPDANVWFLANDAKVRRVATKHTGTKTREANNWATEMEAAILRRLKGKDPLVARPNAAESHEDMVVHLTDCHMGDVVEDEHGVEVFNPDICEQSIEHVTQKALDLKGRMEMVTGFDACHLLWGGDMLTNENIYDGQAHDIGLMLADQMARAVDALTQQAKSLAESFETLQIVAQPGNHGKTRASGVSKQANMDLLCYRWVHDRLAEAGYDNINFIESEATFYRNFTLRDGRWRGHLRHGHNTLPHIDATAASSRDWRGWREEHQFDVAYKGHHHTKREADVMNQYPVIQSPSMKPGAEFASKIGSPDVSAHRQLATVHGVSDRRPVTWKFTADDKELEAT